MNNNNNNNLTNKILYELYSEYAYVAVEKNNVSLPDFAEATIRNLITDLYHAKDLSLSYEDILELCLVLVRKIVNVLFEHSVQEPMFKTLEVR